MENTSIVLKVEPVITNEDVLSSGVVESQNEAVPITGISTSGKAVDSHTDIIGRNIDNESDTSNSKAVPSTDHSDNESDTSNSKAVPTTDHSDNESDTSNSKAVISTDHNIKDNESDTSNSKAVPSTDHNIKENDSVRSDRKAVPSTDHIIKENDSVRSIREAVLSTDHSVSNKMSASLFIGVTGSAYSRRPDMILFIVINTQNNKYVSTLVPYKQSRQLSITGDMCEMAIHAYGLQGHNHAMDWYRVLSHSHLATGLNSSLEQITDSPGGKISRIQMPALVTSCFPNCLPFHTKKTTPVNTIQDEWREGQYTLTTLYRTSGVMFIQQVSDRTTSIHIHKHGHVVIPFPLPSANDFEVHLMEGSQQFGYMLTGCLPTEKMSFRTKMVRKDVFELFGKCFGYLRNKLPRFHRLPYLYRNKSPEYFSDILNNKGGWMYTYIKNDGGDPASVLNGRIKGLFFSAVLQDNTGLPPPKSPFGSDRLFIPTLSVFTNRFNLYFADFYCHSTQGRHKVQLVLTSKGTEEDTFCQQRLVWLDPYRNPFFYKQIHPDGSGLVRVVVTVNVIVEIFLSMDLNIITLQRDYPFDVLIKKTEATTSGTSMVNGLPKCPSCNICNLSRFCS